MARFLAARATATVETVDASGYHRTIIVKGFTGVVSVAPMADADALIVDVAIADPALVPGIAERIAAMFDVDADVSVIGGVLSRDPILKRRLKKHPGIRVPGAWDPFELCVRAILGQQVSVRAATTVAGRIVARWGNRLEDGSDRRLFPPAATLVDAPLEECGIIGARANSIRLVARAIVDGTLSFDSPSAIAVLREVRGIGDWTAEYIDMRANNNKDALPAGDLVLRKKVGGCTARALDHRAEKWRPYRSYATMLLWTAD
jgi:AraC family transcriptional regulator, regulatory protein of adaptative response / DNA-3-methyladenine glycosylase II